MAHGVRRPNPGLVRDGRGRSFRAVLPPGLLLRRRLRLARCSAAPLVRPPGDRGHAPTRGGDGCSGTPRRVAPGPCLGRSPPRSVGPHLPDTDRGLVGAHVQQPQGSPLRGRLRVGARRPVPLVGAMARSPDRALDPSGAAARCGRVGADRRGRVVAAVPGGVCGRCRRPRATESKLGRHRTARASSRCSRQSHPHRRLARHARALAVGVAGPTAPTRDGPWPR